MLQWTTRVICSPALLKSLKTTVFQQLVSFTVSDRLLFLHCYVAMSVHWDGYWAWTSSPTGIIACQRFHSWVWGFIDYPHRSCDYSHVFYNQPHCSCNLLVVWFGPHVIGLVLRRYSRSHEDGLVLRRCSLIPTCSLTRGANHSQLCGRPSILTNWDIKRVNTLHPPPRGATSTDAQTFSPPTTCRLPPSLPPNGLQSSSPDWRSPALPTSNDANLIHRCGWLLYRDVTLADVPSSCFVWSHLNSRKK